MIIKKTQLLIITLVLIFSMSVGCTNPGNKKDKEQLVLIETNMGNIKLKLYNQTPLHRDNFIKLTKQGYFDGLLFHRVIKDFMIQTGDPKSKNAKPGDLLGNGGPGYTVPPEFDTSLFHKKGVLAAAREGDDVNPKKESAGSQFYIVEGNTYTDEELDQVEIRINNMNKKATFFKFIEEEKEKAKENNETFDYSKAQGEAAIKTGDMYSESAPYKIPATQREVYKTLGGTPHLDQNYTVFGEIVEGLPIVDKISNVVTDEDDRPKTDVRIIKMKLVRK
ncbi:MAG: peptidylprolyl isomerase [Bacteroidetes bacterium]|nr:MAG: peptidylprolyl isomerase [Bacteroidota bacterium]